MNLINLLFCCVVSCSAVDTMDARLLAGLDTLHAATKSGAKPNSLNDAIDRLSREIPNSQPENGTVSPTTWATFGQRMPGLLAHIPPNRQIRLLRQLKYCAPESLQKDILAWQGKALAGVLSRVEKELDRESLVQLEEAAELLPRKDSCPMYMLRQQNEWPAIYAREYQAIYAPCATRIEALVRAWQPIRHPSFGTACLRLLHRQPSSQAALRILLERCGVVDGADASLRCGLHALAQCLEPYPEGPVLISKAAAWFKADLPLKAQNLMLWRGDERIGSALVPLMLAGGFGELPRQTLDFDKHNPWFMVLPPPDQRRDIVERLISGLEAGLVPANPGSQVTLLLAFHITCFPEAYGGMLDSKNQSRLEGVMIDRDDVHCLLAFNVLGHLAGEKGIDSAYGALLRLPRVHDLLLPATPRDQKLRGEVEGTGHLNYMLLACRMRLTLCRLPLVGEDRKKVWSWYRGSNDLQIPVVAWLARTAEVGVHPLEGLTGRPMEDCPRQWQQWSVPQATERPRPVPAWRNDLALGVLYARDFPDWSEVPIVVDAALNHAQESQRVLNLLSYEEQKQPSLRTALRNHAGLRAYIEAQTAYLETPEAQQAMQVGQGKMPIARGLLAKIWGDVFGDFERAAEVIAPDVKSYHGISFSCAYLARCQPSHAALDALASSWQSEVITIPGRAFQLWCLEVLRGKDPGQVPRADWQAYLLNVSDVSDDALRVISSNPQHFVKYRDSLRASCPPRLERINHIAEMLAAVQAAADSK